MFTLSNIVTVVGSFFLSGPKTQAKFLISPQMRLATFLYLASMILTFVCAFHKKIPGKDRIGVIVCCIFVQCTSSARARKQRRAKRHHPAAHPPPSHTDCAFIWFTICSIPFCKGIFDRCCDGLCFKYCRCYLDAKRDAVRAGARARAGAGKAWGRATTTAEPRGESTGAGMWAAKEKPQPKSAVGWNNTRL
jgi:hypothetical protein